MTMGAYITKYYIGINEYDPELHNTLAQFPDIVFNEVDVSGNPDLVRRLNIRALPALVGIGVSGYALTIHGHAHEHALTKFMRDLVTHEDG